MSPVKRVPLIGSIILVLMSAVGCLQPAFISDQAGFVAGTGYLMINTPAANEVETAKGILAKISVYAEDLKISDTFSSLYGVISRDIAGELDGRKKLIALSVSRSLLDSLDIFFLAHAEWAENKDTAVALAKAFIRGANRAFDTFAKDPDMRANMFKVKQASARAYSVSTR